MNNTHIQTLVTHFADQLSGEPIPDFRSDEAIRVVQAANAITASPEARELASQLGLRILAIAVDRIVAGATATREIAIIRDNGGELC
jgi:hypothetical protein